MIFMFAAMSVSTAYAQTSVTQRGTSITTSTVNPWVSVEKQAAPRQTYLSRKVKRVEHASGNPWLIAAKNNGQTTVQSKPSAKVLSTTISNPWMKTDESKTIAVPEDKK